MNSRPDPEVIAAAVTDERLALCLLLDDLEPAEWQVRSLCPEWTVREVAAHLDLSTRGTMWGLVRSVVKARGSFDRMNVDEAVERAAELSPADLVQALRDCAASTRRMPMSSVLDPLTDVLVHAQDIARPLGRRHPMPPAHVLLALDHAIDSRWYGGARRFADVTLVATDTDYSRGESGAEVRGRAGDLLLVATGRADALADLTGPGVELLTSQLTTT